MKKINMNRLAATLLVLVLLTSCFVGSTMARYATGTSANDTARAAKFGVTISGYSDVFGQGYVKTGTNGDIEGTTNLTVKTSGGDNIVAPGTKGDNVLSFTIAGSAEVAVKVTATLNATSLITLDDGEYIDYTKYTMATSADGEGSYKPFTQEGAYNPIKWTLKKNGTAVDGCEGVALSVISTKLGSMFGEYDAGDDDFCGTYTLSWIWEYGEDSPADTYIGKAAASNESVTGVTLIESFNFSLSIVQVD